MLRFFVYDQGQGIPASLPRQTGFFGDVVTKLGELGLSKLDSNVIEKAFEVGLSRTGKDERGKGLAKMQKAIQLAGDGYLRVISGHGDVTIGPRKTLKKTESALHIGGTLIEWGIPVTALASDK